jgi:hypothetical protein
MIIFIAPIKCSGDLFFIRIAKSVFYILFFVPDVYLISLVRLEN